MLVTLHFLPATGRRAFNSGHLPGNRGDRCITDRYIFTGLQRPRDVAPPAFIQTASFSPLWMQLYPDPSWKESVFFKMNLNHRGALFEAIFPQQQNVFRAFFFFKTHTSRAAQEQPAYNTGSLGNRLHHQLASFHFYYLHL